jgi:1,4-dihydroxy-2-naphthoyl-CoA hydrolase
MHSQVPAFEVETLKRRPEGAFCIERDVRFQDVDAAGIVFYPRVLEYFSDAFIAFLGERGTKLAEVLRENRWGAPLRHAEADYFKPLRYGDRIEVALVRARLEEGEVSVGWRVARCSDGVVTSVGQTVHVFVDMRTFKRCAIPAELRGAFDALPD